MYEGWPTLSSNAQARAGYPSRGPQLAVGRATEGFGFWRLPSSMGGQTRCRHLHTKRMAGSRFCKAEIIISQNGSIDKLSECVWPILRLNGFVSSCSDLFRGAGVQWTLLEDEPPFCVNSIEADLARGEDDCPAGTPYQGQFALAKSNK